jgi:hypothetical protein
MTGASEEIATLKRAAGTKIESTANATMTMTTIALADTLVLRVVTAVDLPAAIPQVGLLGMMTIGAEEMIDPIGTETTGIVAETVTTTGTGEEMGIESVIAVTDRGMKGAAVPGTRPTHLGMTATETATATLAAADETIRIET